MRRLISVVCCLLAIALPAAAAITYTESNATGLAQASACSGVSSATNTIALAQSGATSGTITTASMASSGGTSADAWSTAAGDPNLTSWASGSWVVSLEVSSATAGIQWIATCIFEVDSSGAYVATVGSLTGQTTDLGTAAVVSQTVSGSALSPAATDRVQVVLVFSNTNTHGGSKSISYAVGGASDTVATPLVSAAPASQVVLIGAL